MIEQQLAGKLCLLRLQRPPLNTIDFPLLDALGQAVRRAESDSAVEAIILTGRPDHFSAGADIHLFEQITSADDARAFSRRFQESYQAIEDCSKPIVCALAGNVMGGALELAMACHRRIATPDARFSLPEIRLAILPGAGGTQRLPRLVGPRKALEMMLTGDSISAADALQARLLDAVCPAEDIVACAGRLIGLDASPRRTGQLAPPADRPALDDALQTTAPLVAKHPAEVIAPRQIVDCVAAGLRGSFAAGILAEREAFTQCVQTLAARNRIYAFFATRQTARLPELDSVEPRNIEKAAVIGMGSMGT
ncbi:MAG: enoyl-CoA hydratase/isomerase family protein, partial [Thermoguttaceae bacterium]